MVLMLPLLIMAVFLIKLGFNRRRNGQNEDEESFVTKKEDNDKNMTHPLVLINIAKTWKDLAGIYEVMS